MYHEGILTGMQTHERALRNMISKMKSTNNNEGFTIIEVVLVLAIAGLIFLMVFIALPALQRSQRDTARKDDVSTTLSSVTSFKNNNKGAFPTTAQINSYVQNKSENTTAITVRSSTSTFTPTDGTIYVIPSATCGGPGTTLAQQTLTSGSARQFAVVTYLEAGGGSAYCLDNQ